MLSPALIWPDYPWLAVAGLVIVAVLVLYLLRAFAHRLLMQLATGAQRQLRLLARSCQAEEQRLAARNREAMAALQEEILQRQIERESGRIRQAIDSDARAFRDLEREINQQIATIAEDYEASAQVPPAAPQWTEAVEAIARLDRDDSSQVMSRILGDIHETVQEHQREAMREYRWTVSTRHKLLARLRPYWRKLSQQVGQLSAKTDQLLARMDHLDTLVSRYDRLREGSEAVKTSSVVTRFVIAGLFLALGVTVAVMGFQLTVEPLSQLLAGRGVLGVELARLAALLHIGLTLGVGLLLCETLRLTRLFPLLAGMDGRARTGLTAVAAVVLVALAAIQAGLASWQAPAAEAVAAQSIWPSGILVTLGFAVPLVLVVALIPLEYFLLTLRPVVAALSQAVLRLLALTLRLSARLARDLGRLAVLCYDAAIFAPLLVQEAWFKYREDKAAAGEAAEPTEQAKPARPNITAVDFDSGRRHS